MSTVSKRVVVSGFESDPKTMRAIVKAFDQFGEVIGRNAAPEAFDLNGMNALIIGGEFDFASHPNLEATVRAVQSGCNLVVLGLSPAQDYSLWQSVLGLRPLQFWPETEWFFKLQHAEQGVGERILHEFPAYGHLASLELTGGANALLETSIGFRNYVSAASLRVGPALVSVFGLTCASRTIPDDLATLVRRSALFDQTNERRSVDSLGVGIVGYGPFGGMGHYHGKAASEVEGFNLVAVVDRDAERRKAAEQEFPNVRTYRTTEELAEDTEVDVCVVATPPVSHFEISLTLLRAGKHVICEKPMCITLQEASELIATANAMDKMLTINQNRRWDRDFSALSSAVRDGRVGEVFNIETFVGGYEHPCRAWHSEESISGGAIYDWGSHHIDQIVRLYGGPPARVSAVGHKRVWHDVTNMDQVRVHMIWEDGREAQFFQSDIAAVRKPKYFVQGTLGTIVGNYRPITQETVTFPFGYQEHEFHHAEAPAVLSLSRYESGYGTTEESLPPHKHEPFAFHRNVANHLLLGEPLAVTPRQAAEVIAVLEAAQLSSTTGSHYVEPKAL